MKYLDKTGLTYLWSKIKSKIPTKTSQLTNDSNYITSSGSTSGNAGSATKLQTARTIGIGTGATGTATSFDGTKNITIPLTDVKDSYVTWGGKGIAGNVSPNDMGCIDEFGHNKLAFLPASCIDVAYSIDGGTTWVDYGLTDAQKVAMVTTTGPGALSGKWTTATADNVTNHKLRIRLACGTTEGSLKIYTAAKKILFNVTDPGANAYVNMRYRTIANYMSDTDTWVNVPTQYDVRGGSGWNSIPFTYTFGGSMTSQTSQIGQFEFVFSNSQLGTWGNKKISVIDIRLIGATNWAYPSELARAGYLYRMDTDQNALFPANITPQVNNSKTLGTSSLKWANVYATTFTGNLSGTSDKSNSTYILDTRSVNSTPNDYMGGGRRVVYEFKNISAINTPFSSGTYCTLKTVCQWDNTGGGLPIQIAYSHTSTKPVMRVATSGTTWGEWKTIALTSDIPTKVSELTNDSGYTTNTGTITGITMNGASKGTSGVVDLGTVITAHQDISGKQDKITSTNKLDYSLLSNTPTIPSAVTESTVSGWGFTKNIGTITTIALNGVNLSTQGLANIPAATTDKYGITKLSNATNSTSEVLAATPKAVKSAYDTAEAAASVASSASASAQNAYDLASVASSASAEALSDIGDMSGLIGGSDIVGAIDTLNVGLTNRPTIETGTGTNGSYIKYSNGILICYGTITGTSPLSDYWSQFNRSAENISFDFPYEFASRPMVNYTSYNYGTVSIVSGRNTTTQGKFTVLKPKNISNTSYEFDYIAIGTWE